MRLSKFFCVSYLKKKKSYNDSLIILILFKMSLQCCLEVLVVSIIDSDINTSGQHFPLHKFAGSQGSYLVCFRQVPVGSKTSVSKAYVQLGYFSYTAIDGLWSSGIIEGGGKALLVIMMFAQPLRRGFYDNGDPQTPPSYEQGNPYCLHVSKTTDLPWDVLSTCVSVN